MQKLEITQHNICVSAVMAFALFPEEIAIREFATETQPIL